MRRRRRIAAYGLCRDGEGRTLVVRASKLAARPGDWWLPGGGIDHGEHPADAVVREVAEETGLKVEVASLYRVLADVFARPDRGTEVHSDRLVYRLNLLGGELTHEPSGTTDRAAWASPDELAGLPLAPYAARVLGLPVPEASPQPPAVAGEPAHDAEPGDRSVVDAPIAVPAAVALATADIRGEHERPRVSRFGAYGLATDAQGRILLARISRGYPGAGRWHLPGGGTEFGEEPEAGLVREIFEETGQAGRVTGLIGVSHLHSPAALGPEGHPIDWHGVRVVYRVVVDEPARPRVTEAAGGSTADADWFAPAEVAGLTLTDLAAAALGGELD